jgi:hypothetical protein
MQRALWESEPFDWVVPTELPEWEPWERGEHVLSYDPYAAPQTTDETTDETTTDEDGGEDEEADDSPPPPPAATPD